MTQKLSDKSFERRRDTDQEITRNNIPTYLNCTRCQTPQPLMVRMRIAQVKLKAIVSFEYDVENVIFEDIPVEHFQF